MCPGHNAHNRLPILQYARAEMQGLLFSVQLYHDCTGGARRWYMQRTGKEKPANLAVHKLCLREKGAKVWTLPGAINPRAFPI